MTYHQGQCDTCQIAWTWTRRIALKDQICVRCGGPLRRVSRLSQRVGTYTWLQWEGYR